jgi:hypothetical protein
MAINQRGNVTTTGMMNKPVENLQVPDMSNLASSQQPVEKKQLVKAEQPVQQIKDPNEINVGERLRNITAEDMTVLEPVLSPSVKRVLAKIMPEITSLLEGVGSNEETIPVKFSVMDSLPTEIQNYILESNNPQTMDNNNVPLDTNVQSGMMAKQPSSMIDTTESDINYESIDSDLV